MSGLRWIAFVAVAAVVAAVVLAPDVDPPTDPVVDRSASGAGPQGRQTRAPLDPIPSPVAGERITEAQPNPALPTAEQSTGSTKGPPADRAPDPDVEPIVGPTFTFDAPSAERIRSMNAPFVHAVTGAGRGVQVQRGGVIFGDGIVQARFRGPVHFTDPDNAQQPYGPAYDLRVRSGDLMLEGVARVRRRVGPEPRTVSLTFEERGAIEFTMASAADETNRPRPSIVLRSVESEQFRDRMRLSKAVDGVHRRSVPGLVPGTYGWELMDASRTARGTVEVRPLESTHVEIHAVEATGVALSLPIDTSAAPGVDLTEWRGALVDLDGLERQIKARPTRFSAAAGGTWSLEFARAPGKRLLAQLVPEKGYRVVPRMLPVFSGREIRGFVVEPERPAPMDILLVEPDGGEPIEGGRISTMSHGMLSSLLEHEAGIFRGQLTATSVLIVDAPSRERVIAIPSAAELTLGSMTIRLVPTGRPLVPVTVLECTEMLPVGGVPVLVDGQRTGETDPASGTVMLEPSTRTRDIQVDLDPARHELVVSEAGGCETLAETSNGMVVIVLAARAKGQ